MLFRVVVVAAAVAVAVGSVVFLVILAGSGGGNSSGSSGGIPDNFDPNDPDTWPAGIDTFEELLQWLIDNPDMPVPDLNAAPGTGELSLGQCYADIRVESTIQVEALQCHTIQFPCSI